MRPDGDFVQLTLPYLSIPHHLNGRIAVSDVPGLGKLRTEPMQIIAVDDTRGN